MAKRFALRPSLDRRIHDEIPSLQADMWLSQKRYVQN